MRKLQELVRPNIWKLKPYSCARDEFQGEATVWLDANESAYNTPYNRYPDPRQQAVKARIADLRGVGTENLFLGVGSDECIDTVYRVFCRPGVDNVVVISPSYGMYSVCADVNDVEYRMVPLADDFSLEVSALFSAVDANTKVVWICSPNNPTGNAFSLSDISDVCAGFDGIVVVDEAYIDFSQKGTAVLLLEKYPNLIVLQTLSKAWASAAVRLGIAIASQEIIGIFNKVKYPYNINLLTQNYALRLFDDVEMIKTWVSTIIAERKTLIEKLSALPLVRKIYPTDANFVLVDVGDANAVYGYLCEKGVVVRNRTTVEKCLGCLRITVGSAAENNILIQALEAYGE